VGEKIKHPKKRQVLEMIFFYLGELEAYTKSSLLWNPNP